MTDLVAGEELDALIATKVMGWTLDLSTRVWLMPDCNPRNNRMLMAYPPAAQYRMCDNTYWRPSTKILDAYAVLTWWKEGGAGRGWVLSRTRRPDAFFCALHDNDTSYGEDYAETPELAVCSAVLKAVEELKAVENS